jgi:hypothetical protein
MASIKTHRGLTESSSKIGKHAFSNPMLDPDLQNMVFCVPFNTMGYGFGKLGVSGFEVRRLVGLWGILGFGVGRWGSLGLAHKGVRGWNGKNERKDRQEMQEGFKNTM